MTLRDILAIGLALGFGVSCNSSDFAGSSSKKAGKPPAKEVPEDEPEPPAKKPGKKPPSDVKDTVDLGKPAGTLDDSGDNTDPVKPGPNSQDAKPNIDNTSDNAQGKPEQSIVDLLANILKENNDVITDQPNDNEVVIGKNQIFHIGDNNFDGSSCKVKIDPLFVSGKKYYFEFDVKKPNTNVTINIMLVCGVDFGDTNFLHLTKGGVIVDTLPVTKDASSLTFTSKAPLDAGLYALVVESTSGSKEAGASPTDFDDYIIGEIDIKASGPIKPGKVGAGN